jgi:hypothetical protein
MVSMAVIFMQVQFRAEVAKVTSSFVPIGGGSCRTPLHGGIHCRDRGVAVASVLLAVGCHIRGSRFHARKTRSGAAALAAVGRRPRAGPRSVEPAHKLSIMGMERVDGAMGL